MITINLTPEEELESPFWFVPDLAALLVAAVIAFLVVEFYFNSIREQIAQAEADQARSLNGFQMLNADVVRHNSLQKDIAELDARLVALKRITSSNLVRYRPVIILEHLQSLKPEGVWFESVTLLSERPPIDRLSSVALAESPVEGEQARAESEKLPERPIDMGFDSIVVMAKALDNILVAEFMSSLKSTFVQDVDPSDLRTQIYFADLRLDSTRLVEMVAETNATTDQATSANAAASETQRPKVAQFELMFRFREHASSVEMIERRDADLYSIFPGESKRQARL